MTKKQISKKQEKPIYPNKRLLLLMCGFFVIFIVALIITTDRSRFYEGGITYITEKVEPTSAVIDIACYTYDKKIESRPITAELKMSEEFYPVVLKLYNEKVVVNKFIKNFDLSISNKTATTEIHQDDCRARDSHMTFHITHIIDGQEMGYSATCNYDGDEKDRKSISVIMDDIEQSFKACIENYTREV